MFRKMINQCIYIYVVGEESKGYGKIYCVTDIFVLYWGVVLFGLIIQLNLFFFKYIVKYVYKN